MTRTTPWSRTFQAALALLLVGGLLYLLRAVLSPVFFAFLLAYMLDPLADRFEAAGWPRTAGIVVVLTVSLLGLALFALVALPTLLRDFKMLAEQLPLAVERVVSWLAPLMTRVGLPVPSSLDELADHLQRLELRALAPSAMAPAKAFLSGVLGGTASFFGAVAGAVMVPIFAFYLLEDFDRIVARVHALLPAAVRERVASMTREVDSVLGQFVRGQLTVMALLAVLYAVGYALIGVPLALPIGVLAGLLSFIPYAGGAAALGMALLMALLHYEGLTQLLLIGAVYTLIQLLEGFVITPKIVGDKLGLAPVWVLFALMVGGNLFGFLGVMLALPAAAVVKVFVAHGLARYQQSELFLGDADSSSARDRDFLYRHRRRRRNRRPRRLRTRGGLAQRRS